MPGKFITEFIRKLTNEMIELELNDKNQMIIKYDDSQSIIQCYNVLEYPSFKKLESLDYFGIAKKDLKTIINKTIKNSTRTPCMVTCENINPEILFATGDKMLSIRLSKFIT